MCARVQYYFKYHAILFTLNIAVNENKLHFNDLFFEICSNFI